MVLTGVDFWYDNYSLWPWQAKPRPKTAGSLANSVDPDQTALLRAVRVGSSLLAKTNFVPVFWVLWVILLPFLLREAAY